MSLKCSIRRQKMSEDANSFSKTLKTCQKALQRADSSMGPLGKAVSGFMQPALSSVANTSSKAATKLQSMGKKLDPKADKIRKYAAKAERLVPFNVLQTIDRTVTRFEKHTGELAKNWAKVKNGCGNRAELQVVEAQFQEANSCVNSFSNNLKGAADTADQINKASTLAHEIMTSYRKFQAIFAPAFDFLTWIGKTVQWVVDKIFEQLFKIPFVKWAVETIGSICQTIVDKFLEITGLKILFNTLGEKLNPFRAFLNLVPESVQNLKFDALDNLVPNTLKRNFTMVKLVSIKTVVKSYSGNDFQILVPSA